MILKAPVYNFQDQLRKSEARDLEPFWECVYRRAFPDMLSHMRVPGPSEAQRLGQDRVLQLACGEVLHVDEKVIGERNDDKALFLEFVSVDTQGKPGWIEKELRTDFIAFGFAHLRSCYLLPWPHLRAAWRATGEAWKQRFGVRKIPNEGYHTHGVTVPAREIIEVCPVQMVRIGEEELKNEIERQRREGGP
jgi:hypothetical protein